ncbi:serine hydrolase domain-containing protein [Geodermatophilus sp. SYSU D00684]
MSDSRDASGGTPGAAVGRLEPREVASFFDAVIPRQLEEKRAVGATVAVVAGDRIVHARGYGFADLATHVPARADRTLFYLGSAGKLFTWTAVMQLVEAGAIGLDVDVTRYLDFEIPPAFPEPITARHLLTHTPGFEDEYAAELTSPGNVLPLRDFLIRYQPQRVYRPGSTFAYSNYGTVLAGYLVERVSGVPFERYVTDRVLRPLGMTRSTLAQPPEPELLADLSRSYRVRRGRHDAVDLEWNAAAPAAGVRATATDVAAFMIAHLGDGRYRDVRILGETTARQMRQRQFTHDPRLSGQGFGFALLRANGQDIAWHDGESARTRTILALLPAQRVGVFVSYNTPTVDEHQTLVAFLDRFWPPADRVTPASGDTARTPTRRYAGAYVSARAAHSGPQKLVAWLTALRVRGGADGALRVGDQVYAEREPGLFQQVGGERRLTFGTDARGRSTRLYWEPTSAYFEVPWHETPAVQAGTVLACLGVFVSAVVAWPLGVFSRRGRGQHPPAPVIRLARWPATLAALLALGLAARFAALMRGFATTFVYPGEQVARLTRAARVLVPLTGAAVLGAVPVVRRGPGNRGVRAHHVLVTLAEVLFLGWLRKWNLLGGRPRTRRTGDDTSRGHDAATSNEG